MCVCVRDGGRGRGAQRGALHRALLLRDPIREANELNCGPLTGQRSQGTGQKSQVIREADSPCLATAKEDRGDYVAYDLLCIGKTVITIVYGGRGG